MKNSIITSAAVCLVVATGAFAAQATKSANTVPPAAPAAPSSAAKNIVQTATDNGNFKTLCSLLKSAGLVETLNGAGPFTVFAPTDAAFAKLDAATLASLQKDPKALAAILTYHVVPGAISSAEVVKAKEFVTVQGQPIAVTVKEGKVVLNNGATVTAVDIKTSNGVIHVIDTVIMPPAKAGSSDKSTGAAKPVG